MMISIDLTSLVMLVAIVFLVWVMVDMMKARKEKSSPVIVRDVDVYEYPDWYGFGWLRDWWPTYWGSGSGNVWFGPGKPCKGWHCDGGHKDEHKSAPAQAPGPIHPPINITQNNNVPAPPTGPIQTLPIQDVPVQPPTAQQDIQVALAPTPTAIQPEVSNIGTQTEATSTEAPAQTA